MKTKPTQSAVKESRSVGLAPDIIACRCSHSLKGEAVEKIVMFCQVKRKQVLSIPDVDSTYHVPLLLKEQGLNGLLRDGLGLDALNIAPKLRLQGTGLWNEWESLTRNVTDRTFPQVDIALVGKYTKMPDSYTSIVKSLEHTAMACSRRLNIIWIDSVHLEQKPTKAAAIPTEEYQSAWQRLRKAQGILVPGGFGVRGTEGMIEAAKWARTQRVPYLGVCLGMQIAVVEFARHVLGIAGATSSEFHPHATDPVIIAMEELDREIMGKSLADCCCCSVFNS